MELRAVIPVMAAQKHKAAVSGTSLLNCWALAVANLTLVCNSGLGSYGDKGISVRGLRPSNL